MRHTGATGQRWWVLLLLGALNACTIGVFFLTPPLAPFLQADLGITRAQVGLLMSSLLVGAAVMSIPGGWLADKSIRWTILACQSLTTGWLLFFSRTDSLEQALLGTLGMGLAGGAALAGLTKAVATWFDFRERATALGLYFAGGSIGSASGAVLLPALSLAVGWRQTVLIMAMIVLVVGIIGFIFYRDREVPTEPLPPQSRHTSSKLGGLTRSNILVLGLVAILLGAPQYALATYIILYLKEIQSFSIVEAGLFLSVVQGSSLFGRIGWGIVSDKLLGGNRKAVLFIAAALFVVCLSVIASGSSAPGGLLAVMFLAGLTGFSWYGIWTALVAESSKTLTATVIGFGQMFSYLGVIVGPPLFGYVVDSANSYTPAWVGSAVLAGVSTALVLLVKENKTVPAPAVSGAGQARGNP